MSQFEQEITRGTTERAGTLDDRLAALPAQAREQLLARLSGRAESAPAPGVRQLRPIRRDAPAPLSPGQQRLWYLHEVDPHSTEFNTVRVLRIRGPLDTGALRAALDGLVRRHEPLRTTFLPGDGSGAQLIHPAGEVPLPLTDLSEGSAPQRESALARALDAELAAPFDLRTGPLFRARLLRLGALEHVLVLGLHHIVTDGWSMGVLTRDLFALYEERTGGPAAALPELPVQYADVAAWQRERGDSPGTAAQLDYWRSQLAGLGAMELPTDRARPPVRSGRGADHTFTLDAAGTDGLRRLCQEHGASLFMGLATAVQVLLARWSGSEDIAVGTAVAGRDRVETEELVGFFVNNLVLRTTVDEDLTFGALLRRVRSTALDAFSHQEVPFQHVVEAIRPDRDPSRPPLAEVSVSLHNAPDSTGASRGLEISTIEPPRTAAGMDLAFEFTERDGELDGRLVYATDLYTPGTARQLTGRLTTLLREVLSNPDRPLARATVLGADEERQLLHEWGGTGAGREPRCAPGLFAEQVARRPDATALVSDVDGETLTYAELDGRSDRLARLLTARGAAPDTIVAVSLPRSSDMVVAVLAVLKTGAAYLPLDPALPAERLRYLLTDAAPAMVVTAPGTRPADCPAPLTVLGTPETEAALDALPPDAPTAGGPLLPSHPAYIIYTSGSTGRPKGVVVTHTGVHGLVTAQAERFAVDDASRVLQFASLGFDAAFSELGMALFTGAALVVAEQDRMLGEALPELTRKHSVTHVTLPPSVLATLPPDALPGRLTLVVAGEACPPGLARTWAAGRRMINAYGPTEATVCATMSDPLSPDLPAAATSVPVGRPLDGVRVRVLDRRLRPVPAGAPGEVYLSGRALAQGYLRRAPLTAERFVADPYGPPGGRMYRTGDRARWLPDGTLDYLGRTDDQVKLRGFRIEPGEIEAVLSQHPELAAAAVTVKRDERGNRRLVAYAVPAAGHDPQTARLRTYAREHLPEHMVPALFVRLDRLPVNANGKTDRAALPDPDPRRDLDEPRIAPRTPAERTLAAIWSELLGVDTIGVQDNFFELGGDSILSLQVVARARDAGLALTAKQTFLRQTVADLAAVAGQAGTGPAHGGEAPEQGRVTGDVPLLPIQHWFLTELPESRTQFNQSLFWELAEDTDLAALETALTALPGRHDALRLRALREKNGWRLSHTDPDPDPGHVLRRTDLSGLDPAAQDAAMREENLRAQHDFPLATGPLLRARLYILGAHRPPRLFLTAHHLVVDAVSWQILLADLEKGYRQVRDGEPLSLGAKGVSFRRWSQRLHEHTADGGFADEAAYWRSVEAAVASAATLPVDGDGPNTVAAERTVTVALSQEATEALLRQVPRAYRTRVNEVLLSALAPVLTEWTGQDRAALALEGHGREDVLGVDPSRTVGWFTTLFPVALEVPRNGGWDRTLKSVKEQLRGVPGHGIGYGALRYLTESGEGLGAAPEPPVSFNYLGRFDGPAADSPVLRRRCAADGAERAPEQPRRQLIEINGSVTGGRLEFRWSYAEGVHRRETVERLAVRFQEALEEITAHCTAPGAGGRTPSDFPLAALDQAAVDRIAGTGTTVEDIYPLTPAQSGMLFHALSGAAGDRDMYTGHFGVRIDGVTDPQALADAWQQVVDRTPVLRTRVLWENVTEPLQVVHTGVRVPLTLTDLRELSEEARQEALSVVWEQRAAGSLDLTTAPLLDLCIARLTDSAVQLFWSVHHLVMDGWSFSELLGEVLTEYAARTGPDPDATRPEMPARRPYRDYVAWLAAQDEEAARAYWSGVLQGFTAPTPLPYDRVPVRAHGTRSSRELRLRLSPDRSRRLYATARAARLTVNTLVQGAWAQLLSRYSGERQVCFGATVAGRPADLTDAGRMMGLFINTVPVRVRTDGTQTTSQWLRELQAAQLDSRAYEYVSAARIQRYSGAPSGAHLFDSIVVFENYPYDSESASRHGLRLGSYLGDEHTNYPLTLTAHAAEELQLALGYDPAVFDTDTIERLADYLDTLLEAMAEDPEAPVSQLPPATREELRRLAANNDTDVAHPPARCVHELFAEQARRTPDAVAVSDDTSELTFTEVDERSSRLAHRLAELGVKPGVLVGVCTGRHAGTVVALLAVLKAGGAFVPLDPSFPAARLRLMLEDSAAPVVVTEERYTGLMPAGGTEIICLDRDADRLLGQPVTPPPDVAAPDDLAYVVYTSGTTGRPKGVMVEHRHVHHMVRAWDKHHGLTAMRPRVLSVSSLSVDLFFGDFLLSALFGGAMVICPAEAVADPVALADRLLDSRAELLVTVPALAHALVTEFTHRGQRPESLRLLMVGSEGWPADAAREVRAGLGAGTVVVNAYGSTETTVDSTVFRLGTEPMGRSGYVPIGRPLANTRIHVLDENLRPVPLGVTGECCIGGDGVSRGYLGRPELTAERFVRDPFADDPDARMYRTGDLVRRRPDGVLECLGRVDDQVKIRGFRVELGEVEAALSRHPEVAAAAAVLRRDGSGTDRLVGYVTAADGGAGPDPDALREFVSDGLPAPAVPTVVTLLPELPMTTSGTVDRRALPQPRWPAAAAGEYVPPRGGTEKLLARIWCEVLGIERVGATDNFFALGGDSVLSIQVISAVRAANGAAVSPRQLFDTPTVAGLAAALDGPDAVEAPVEELLTPVRRDGPLPLSSGQQRLWFLYDFEPESSEYHTVFAVRLRGELDTQALATALDALVARHEPLRTTYATVDGTAVQTVREPFTTALPVTELPEDGPEDTEEAVREHLRQETARPFDLGEGPVFRAVLVRTGAQEHLFALIMHHIGTDGWSMGVLSDDLSAFYTAAVTGEPVEPAPLPLQYADYAVWQRRRAAGPVMAEHLEYWREKLRGITPLELPLDRPRPAVRESAGELKLVEIPAEVVDGLKAVARRQDATLFMALLAAVQVLLARWTGQDDIVVGTPASGRDRQELQGLLGFFVNTVVMRSTVDESETFPAFLSRVRDTALEAFVHGEAPFEQLIELVQDQRDPSRNALVEVMVGLENTRPDSMNAHGLSAEEVSFVSGEVSHDLSFDFVEHRGALLAGISYSTALFDAATVDRFAAQLQRLLAGVVGDHERMSGLPLEDEEALARKTGTWNDTSRDIPPGPVTGYLEEQAAAFPDRKALIASDDPASLSFGELNAAVNRLAHLLISRGIGPEDLVAVPGTRTTGTVVAVLAVLKAGAAYLPLDPSLPPARLGLILEDARPALVLLERDSPDRLPGMTARTPVLHLADAAGDLTGCPDTDPRDADRRTALRPEHPAYLLYTSGSTGRPKGVVVEHRNLSNVAADHLGKRFRPAAAAIPGGILRSALTATFSFDSSLGNLLALMGGAETHILDDRTRLDPEALAAYIAEHRIEHLEITPTYAELLLRAGMMSPGRHRPSLIIVGGEAVGDALWQELAATGAAYNSYGPTECTIDTLYGPITADSRPVIGRPMTNSRVQVLDARLRPAPVGVPGELYLSGAQVSRGYLGRPALTAGSFVPDPLGAPGERMYRTGDRGRWTADGRIEFLGRADGQVKVRGFRIELGEIEAVLGTHPGIGQCAVAVRGGPGGAPRIVAYATATGTPPDQEELRRHLEESLPPYMVPAGVTFLDGLPMTASGKVDRGALPEPELSTATGTYTAPRTEVEHTLSHIWAQVLDTARVGLDDNFFELGGDSILSMQAVHRIRQAGLTVTAKDIFLRQTVRRLAEAVGTAPQPTAAAEPVTGPVPLTPIQREFFAREPLAPHHFSQSVLIELAPDAEESQLGAALSALLEQHDALRTRFVQEDGQWHQHVVPGGTVEPAVYDLPADEEAGQAELEQRATELNRDLDLAQGPLLRAALFRRGAGRPSVLYLTAHHLVVDAVSWRILLDDLETAYRQAAAGEPVALGPRTTSFQQWSRLLGDQVAQGAFDDQLAHWAGLPEPLPLPGTGTGTATAGSVESCTVTLDGEVSELLLHRAPGAFRSRVHHVLFAALAHALSRWTGTPEVVIDLEGHGREDIAEGIDLTRTTGWFTTLYPVAVTVPGADGDWPALVKSVRRQLRKVPGNGLGYGALRRLSADGAPGAVLRDRTDPQVVFNYHGSTGGAGGPEPAGRLCGRLLAPAGEEQDPREEVTHPLDIVGVVEDGRLTFTWHYASELLSEKEVREVAEEFADALRAIAAHTGRR
ncbi:amino acid adenylation domain-containing protein [Streptomyces sp. ACA25]|uniref:non-ribosomal peptide synthetase n=1 Tax=Streptomyces sp. ACA25 TaxID=3022596 RepID=UPI0023071DA9|nr:non-ribosomal peptide synthetase [Streptomyces sp. ACA25]MDB1088334.1 amino acid adenylation domain-containing protein [Streptomyces sp. ACA25]